MKLKLRTLLDLGRFFEPLGSNAAMAMVDTMIDIYLFWLGGCERRVCLLL